MIGSVCRGEGFSMGPPVSFSRPGRGKGMMVERATVTPMPRNMCEGLSSVNAGPMTTDNVFSGLPWLLQLQKAVAVGNCHSAFT